MDLAVKNSIKPKNGDRAVVIGGSIAGMLAARVLADHFTSVTIVETDKLPENAIARSGVPQSVQPHVLFTKGYRILEQLFPNIGDELSAAGALTIDWLREFHHFIHGGWSAKAESASDLVSFTCSRPLLESAIRSRLADFANVQFMEKHRVTGLLLNSSNDINGVCLRPIGGTNQEELSATLVVDAGGRRSQAPQWLESLGFTPPPETVVNPYLGYATRRYREPEGFEPDWKVMLISHSPPDGNRLGYLARIEGGEWIATLGGYGGDFPPLNNEGFLEFARSLPSLKFYEAIKQAEPVSPIYAHRATANRLRHYEKVTIPEGFVSLGDAVCALCPVYGQGMTLSALSAMLLQQELGKPRRLNSSSFQKDLAKSNSMHWSSATTQDSGFPTTKRLPEIPGQNKAVRLTQLMRWYTKQLQSGANSDPDLHALMMQVGHILKSPLALYHPKVVWRVITGSRSKGA